MSDKPAKIEHYEKRFGIIAIEMGYISHQDLIMALKIQVLEDLLDGKHRLIGTILLDENKITSQQIQEVMEIMFCKTKMASEKTAKIIHFPSEKSISEAV